MKIGIVSSADIKKYGRMDAEFHLKRQERVRTGRKIWAVIDWSKIDGGRSLKAGFRKYTAALIDEEDRDQSYIVGIWARESWARRHADRVQLGYEQSEGRKLPD